MTIDVVIPVYNAQADLERCVDSVLAHTDADYRLILIDDASPDPAIAAYFDSLAKRGLPHVALLRNDRNLGFTGTANRGMREGKSDVVLLNSDTAVTSGWLDSLLRCAASDATIGTITPFSNNAEICSFPNLCENHRWPDAADPEPVRKALERAAVPSYPELPTGVGFCLYIRRSLIDAIGVFDPVFGRGYGEENDFCMRAAEAGFRNVLCDDAFVLHTGERSFKGEKSDLGVRNMALLLERHPRYQVLVRDFIAKDPIRPLRLAAQAQLAIAGGTPGILHIIHGHGGGTEHHVRALIDALRGCHRHYLAIAVGDRWQVEEYPDAGEPRQFEFHRTVDEAWPDFVGGLCAAFAIRLIHLHNISGCRDGILEALAALPLPYGYTLHDLNFGCPAITFVGTEGLYCGAPTDPARCNSCLAARPAGAPVDIVSWREKHRPLMARASFLIAPSKWAAETFARYFPEHAIEVIPHGAPAEGERQSIDATAPPAIPLSLSRIDLPDDDVPTVAVLGAIGPDKGARRLDRLVDLARSKELRIRFVLIGYLDRQLTAWQSDDALFTVHGRYLPHELPGLLDHYRVRLVAFPSAGPETFSLTLSEAWSAGRPVAVPPFGALAERVEGTGAGWVWTEEVWRDESLMLDDIAGLLRPSRAAQLAIAATRARQVDLSTLREMADATASLYAALPTFDAWTPAGIMPFEPMRVRDALGYFCWTVSETMTAIAAANTSAAVSPEVSKASEPGDPADGARRWFPVRWVEALKSRWF